MQASTRRDEGGGGDGVVGFPQISIGRSCFIKTWKAQQERRLVQLNCTQFFACTRTKRNRERARSVEDSNRGAIAFRFNQNILASTVSTVLISDSPSGVGDKA